MLKVSSIVETVLRTALIGRMALPDPAPFGFMAPPVPISPIIFWPNYKTALRGHIFRLPMKRGNGSLLSLAKGYGLVDRDDASFLDVLLYIRTRYAHSFTNHVKTIIDLLDEARETNSKNSRLENLKYRSKIRLPERPGIDEVEIGIVIFLVKMSVRLNPPPLPPAFGGWLEVLKDANSADPEDE